MRNGAVAVDRRGQVAAIHQAEEAGKQEVVILPAGGEVVAIDHLRAAGAGMAADIMVVGMATTAVAMVAIMAAYGRV